MSPRNLLVDARNAFADAEEAWSQWRASPPIRQDDVARGHELERRLIEAAHAYCAQIRSETRTRLHYTTRPGAAAPVSEKDWNDDVIIPSFLRRLAD